MTITLAPWMALFAIVPIGIFVGCFSVGGYIDKDSLVSGAVMTALLWLFMGLARFLP